MDVKEALQQLRQLQQSYRHMLDYLPPQMPDEDARELYAEWERVTTAIMTLEAGDAGTLKCQRCGESDQSKLLLDMHTFLVMCTSYQEKEGLLSN